MLNVFTGSVFFSWDSVLKMHYGHYKTQDIFTDIGRMLKEVFWKVLSQCMEGGDPESLKYSSTRTQNVNINVNANVLWDSVCIMVIIRYLHHSQIYVKCWRKSVVETKCKIFVRLRENISMSTLCLHCMAGTRRGRGLQWTPKVGFTPETLASGNWTGLSRSSTGKVL